MSITYQELSQDLHRIARECGNESGIDQEVLDAKQSFVSLISTLLANNIIIQEYGAIEAHKRYELQGKTPVNNETLYQLYSSIHIAFQEGVVDSILSSTLSEGEYFTYLLLANEYKKFGNEGVKDAITQHELIQNMPAESFTYEISRKVLSGTDFTAGIKELLLENDINIDDEKIYEQSNDHLVVLIHHFNKHLLDIIQKSKVFFIQNTSGAIN